MSGALGADAGALADVGPEPPAGPLDDDGPPGPFAGARAAFLARLGGADPGSASLDIVLLSAGFFWFFSSEELVE